MLFKVNNQKVHLLPFFNEQDNFGIASYLCIIDSANVMKNGLGCPSCTNSSSSFTLHGSAVTEEKLNFQNPFILPDQLCITVHLRELSDTTDFLYELCLLTKNQKQVTRHQKQALTVKNDARIAEFVFSRESGIKSGSCGTEKALVDSTLSKCIVSKSYKSCNGMLYQLSVLLSIAFQLVTTVTESIRALLEKKKDLEEIRNSLKTRSYT
ncbi:hypothetical protein EGR_04513 [Echinococcus granulosus]|uniref:Uncharacterized protein n=1 Tax=Echinococcus granulosus TaxID=6210 RepID=W6UGN6_ECHGR|nr:hypothetical protein EGR_04513 [Echinococcus granulosus]EUB60680.1 hypothetical protein EGR_04513 [Echinococcus granulosus]